MFTQRQGYRVVFNIQKSFMLAEIVGKFKITFRQHVKMEWDCPLM